MELTVPWEDYMEEAHDCKTYKYLELSGECRRNGWKAHCEPIEAGCRGFAGHSLLGHSAALESEGCRREEPSRTSLMQLKMYQGGCGSRGAVRGLARYLDTNQRLIA